MGTVAVICPRFPPDYGGPGIAFSRIASRLFEQGIRTTVICKGDKKLHETAGNNVIEIYRITTGSGRIGRIHFGIKVVLKLIFNRGKYQHIHAFTAGWLTFLLPVLGKLLRRRTTFMMTLLDSDDPVGIKSTKYGGIKAYLFKYYDNYIAINPEQKKRIEKVYGNARRVINGSVGIDINTFSPPSAEEKEEARNYFGIPTGVKVAAFAGNISERKGIKEAVEVWLEVLNTFPDAVFLILGPAFSEEEQKRTLYPSLLETIKQAGREDNFKFLWHESSRDTVRKLMRAADIYLFPSRKEGTPSSVMEAMACGVPPAVTPLDGFTGHIVRNSLEGIVLYREDSRKEWADKITELLSNPDLIKKMGKAGRERVMQYHSQTVAIKAYCEAWGIS